MNKRMHKISNLIKDESPDIVCLQEMSSTSFSMIDKLISTKYTLSIFILDTLKDTTMSLKRVGSVFASHFYTP